MITMSPDKHHDLGISLAYETNSASIAKIAADMADGWPKDFDRQDAITFANKTELMAFLSTITIETMVIGQRIGRQQSRK